MSAEGAGPVAELPVAELPVAALPGAALVAATVLTAATALVVAVFASLTSAYILLGMTTGQMLKDAQAKADRLDPGWTSEAIDASREKIPEPENSAYLISRLLKAMPTSWPPIPRVQTHKSTSSAEFGQDILTRFREVPPNVRLSGSLAAEARNELSKLGDVRIQASFNFPMQPKTLNGAL